MANLVTIQFDADTSGLQSTKDFLLSIGAIDKKTADAFDKHNAARVQGTQQQARATENLGDKLRHVGGEGEKAHEKLSRGAKNSTEGLSSLTSSLNNVALGIAAAFGTQQIIAFGKASIRAFAEAEKANQQLLFALNNRKDVQERLIKQAEKLGKAVAIEPDTIVKQQAFLAVQGRTETEINKTIKAAVQLSAVLGQDLTTSVLQLSGTQEGVFRGLGRLDDRFKALTKEELINGAAIDLVNEKYKGFAESTLETVAGKLQQAEVRVEQLKQKIGKDLSGAFVGAQESALTFFDKVFIGFQTLIDGEGTRKKLHEEFLEGFQNEIDAQAQTLFGTKSIIELEKELRRVKGLGFKNDLEKQQVTGQIKAIQDLIANKRRERDQELEASTKKEIISLENLKNKLTELKEQQDKLADPQGEGKDANQKLIDEIIATQNQIDEITGKAQEGRTKKAKEEAEKQKKILEKQIEDSKKLLEETDLDFFKNDLKRIEREKKAADESIEIQQDAELKKREAQSQTLQNTLDNKEIEEQIAKELAEAKLEIAQSTAQEISDTVFQIQSNSIQAEADEALSKLETQKEKELENKRLTAAQRKAIEERYQKEEAKIKRDAAVKERTAAIIQAQVNGLLAITNVIAHSNPALWPFLIASAIVTDALQVAAITSKPLPTYRYGIESIEGPGTTTSDSILARLSKGERITDAQTNEDYFPILSAIHHKKISPAFANAIVEMSSTPEITPEQVSGLLTLSQGGLSIDYDKLGRSMAMHYLKAMEESNYRNRNSQKDVADALKQIKIEQYIVDPRRR